MSKESAQTALGKFAEAVNTGQLADAVFVQWPQAARRRRARFVGSLL